MKYYEFEEIKAPAAIFGRGVESLLSQHKFNAVVDCLPSMIYHEDLADYVNDHQDKIIVTNNIQALDYYLAHQVYEYRDGKLLSITDHPDYLNIKEYMTPAEMVLNLGSVFDDAYPSKETIKNWSKA